MSSELIKYMKKLSFDALIYSNLRIIESLLDPISLTFKITADWAKIDLERIINNMNANFIVQTLKL